MSPQFVSCLLALMAPCLGAVVKPVGEGLNFSRNVITGIPSGKSNVCPYKHRGQTMQCVKVMCRMPQYTQLKRTTVKLNTF